MGLREVWAALRVTWWAPLIGLILGAAAAVVLSLSQPKEYLSTTQFFVSTTDSRSANDVYSGSLFSEQRAASYAELLTGERLADRVVRAMRLDMSPKTLSHKITAKVVPDTVLLDVSVTDRSPERARAIARAVGVQFPDLIEGLEAANSTAASPVKVAVVKAPELPTAPSSPTPVRDGLLGAAAGLLIGVLGAIMRARMDRTVRDNDLAASLTGAPVIGVVLKDDTLDKQHTIDRARNSRTAEDYRQLRNNLQFLNVDDPPRVIMVSSAVPSEGKTTVVVNLGLTLAETGQKVTIIEADLRRPKVTRYLGLVSGAGLTNVLSGGVDLDEVIQPYGDRHLSVLAAGPTPPNPGELLASSQMAALVEKLRGRNDFVLVDAPPLLPVADSSGLAVLMDGVVLSIRFGSTLKSQVEQAAATLRGVNAHLLGCIVNIVPAKAELATAYAYGYDYGYEAGRHRKDGLPT